MSIPTPQNSQLPAPRSSSLPSFPFPTEEEGPDLRRYLQLFGKHRWLLLGVVLTTLLVTALETFTSTPLYRSTLRLEIDPEGPHILPYKELYESAGGYYATEYYLQTQHRILQSRSLAQRVVRRLDLAQHPAFQLPVQRGLLRDFLGRLTSQLLTFGQGLVQQPSPPPAASSGDSNTLVNQFLSALEVRPIERSRLVEISYTSPDPQLASLIANTLAREYMEAHFESKYEATTRAAEFLEKQLSQLQQKVEKSEEELIRYAKANDILNLNEKENIALQNLTHINEALARVEAELIDKAASYEALQNSREIPASLKTELMLELETRKLELERKLASLSTRFGPKWPELKQTQEELTNLTRQLQEERERVVQRAKMEYAIVLTRHRKLAARLDEQKQLANRLSESSIQYNILLREVQTNKQLYDGLLQRLKEAGISAGLKSNNIRIIDPAEVPSAPFLPRPTRNLTLGLLFGLLLGLGMMVAAEHLDNSLKAPEEVERYLYIPSLQVIPSLQSLQPSRFPARKGRYRKPSLLQKLVQEADAPQGPLWETYRSLRTSILLSHPERPPRSLLFTSTVAGEGKTSTAAATAVVLAQAGYPTLLVDLDMRKPDLGKAFGIAADLGISRYLSGNDYLASQITPTAIPNLFLLPAGPTPPNPAELLASSRLADAMALLSEHFRNIIIDTPPLLSVSDAYLSSRLVDGVVLVLRAGRTPRKLVRRAAQQLRSVGVSILGVVLNDVRAGGLDYYSYNNKNAYSHAYSSSSFQRRNTTLPTLHHAKS